MIGNLAHKTAIFFVKLEPIVNENDA